jgi:hypothetical protein
MSGWRKKQIQKKQMNEPKLSEASLEAMLIAIRKHLDETGDRVSLIPTQLIVRPSDLEALGLTLDEVTKMIKEKNNAT